MTTRDARAEHRKGILLTVAGVACISPDALLLRLIGMEPTPLLFWRGLLLALALVVYLLVIERGRHWPRLSDFGWMGLVCAAVIAFNKVTFVWSIELTAAANTLVILAAAPLIASLMSVVVLREAVPLRTWVAGFAVVFGIVIVVSGGVRIRGGWGDAAALASAIAVAVFLVIARRRRNVSMMPTVALAGLMIALGSAAVGAVEMPGARDAALLALLGLVFLPLAWTLIMLGPRYLPAPEVALLLPLEALLGPVWVWLWLEEVPPVETFVGGTIILVTIVAHGYAGLRATRVAARREAGGSSGPAVRP